MEVLLEDLLQVIPGGVFAEIVRLTYGVLKSVYNLKVI